jgi:hypothetical protein
MSGRFEMQKADIKARSAFREKRVPRRSSVRKEERSSRRKIALTFSNTTRRSDFRRISYRSSAIRSIRERREREVLVLYQKRPQRRN